LNHWGKQNGLELSGLTSQVCFLLALGLTSQISTTDAGIASGFLKNFVLDMGRKLKVLVQQKGMEPVFLRLDVSGSFVIKLSLAYYQ